MTIFDCMGHFPTLEKSTKLSVSWYGVPVPSSRYLGKKWSIGDATVRRKKVDATVKLRTYDIKGHLSDNNFK